MVVHVGKKIRQVADQKGVKIAELGRRINTARQNVYKILAKKTIDTGLLLKISNVLEHDFFQYYTPLKEENQKLREENTLLKDMIKLLKDKNKKKPA
jgi:transcriptional regulator with XRE-family HTH domain